jgi:hypothetical protein
MKFPSSEVEFRHIGAYSSKSELPLKNCIISDKSIMPLDEEIVLKRSQMRFANVHSFDELALLMNLFLDGLLLNGFNYLAHHFIDVDLLKEDLKTINTLGYIIDVAQIGKDFAYEIYDIHYSESSKLSDFKRRGEIAGMMSKKYAHEFALEMAQKNCVVYIDNTLYRIKGNVINILPDSKISFAIWASKNKKVRHFYQANEDVYRHELIHNLASIGKIHWADELVYVRVIQVEFASSTYISKLVLEGMQKIKSKFP